MNKIIDLFNTPQAELTYIEQLIIGLTVTVIFSIVMALAYLIINWIKK